MKASLVGCAQAGASSVARPFYVDLCADGLVLRVNVNSVEVYQSGSKIGEASTCSSLTSEYMVRSGSSPRGDRPMGWDGAPLHQTAQELAASMKKLGQAREKPFYVDVRVDGIVVRVVPGMVEIFQMAQPIGEARIDGRRAKEHAMLMGAANLRLKQLAPALAATTSRAQAATEEALALARIQQDGQQDDQAAEEGR